MPFEMTKVCLLIITNYCNTCLTQIYNVRGVVYIVYSGNATAALSFFSYVTY